MTDEQTTKLNIYLDITENIFKLIESKRTKWNFNKTDKINMFISSLIVMTQWQQKTIGMKSSNGGNGGLIRYTLTEAELEFNISKIDTEIKRYELLISDIETILKGFKQLCVLLNYDMTAQNMHAASKLRRLFMFNGNMIDYSELRLKKDNLKKYFLEMI